MPIRKSHTPIADISGSVTRFETYIMGEGLGPTESPLIPRPRPCSSPLPRTMRGNRLEATLNTPIRLETPESTSEVHETTLQSRAIVRLASGGGV